MFSICPTVTHINVENSGRFVYYIKVGLPESKIPQNQLDGSISPLAKSNFYLSGKNDGQAIQQQRKKNAKYATKYGEKKGLIQNEHSKRLPKSDREFINAISRAAGVKTVIVDTMEANGLYSDGVIMIASDAKTNSVYHANTCYKWNYRGRAYRCLCKKF